MGRWLDALKKLENADNEHPQNPQKYASDGSGDASAVDDVGVAASAPAVAMTTPVETRSAKDPVIVLPIRPVSAPRERGGERAVVLDLAKARGIHELQPGDIERYADVLRERGSASYGQMMDYLNWGATRAGRAESALKEAGRIRFNGMARASLIEEGEKGA